MRKIYLVLLALAGISIVTTLSSNSGGRGASGGGTNTGAPSEGTCADCHSGGSFGSTSSIQVFNQGTTTAVTAYSPGTTYDVKFTVNTTTAASGYGFQMTALRSANATSAGTWSAPGSNVQLYSSTGGRKYVEQNARSASNVFTMRWTAPASGNGSVVFYGAGNSVNGIGTGGDQASTTSITLTELVASTLSTTITNTNASSCNANGTATVTATNGTTPYAYNWSNGRTTASITGLTAGAYSVTVTDASAGSSIRSVTVTQPTAITITPATTNTSCGFLNGTANVSVSGGTSPYGYLWSNGATTSSLTGLAVGGYAVTVFDANQCSATRTLQIGSSTAVTATTTSTSTTCGQANGSAAVTASGGTSPYIYAWSNGRTTSSITGLAAGGYAVTVFDANQCSAVRTLQIGSSTAVTATTTSTSTTCGQANGSAAVTASGGTSPYIYAWSNGRTTSSITGLTAGSYSVTVFDASQCAASASVNVTSTGGATLNVTSTATTCGLSNGSATTSASGGTAPYAYLWSNGRTTTTITGLAAGTYSVTVRDANQCANVASTTVTASSSPVTNPSGNNVSCFGGANGVASANTVTGGTAPYTYLWSNQRNTVSITGLAAGTYSVTVRDANQCTATGQYVVTQPQSALTANVTVTNTPSGQNQGRATANAAGGTTPYSYSWSNQSTAQTTTGLAVGTYSVTVRDANQCTATANGSIIINSLVNAETFKLTVGPNPTTNQINLYFGKPTEWNCELAVYSLNGSKLLSGQVSANTERHSLDVSTLIEGVYNLVISNTKGDFTTVRFTK
jgi:hypothetical protein